MNILVVDDSPLMRRFICRSLHQSALPSVVACEAGNGQEAIACLEAQTADLILCDVNMPEMDGQDFLQRLQQDRRFCSIPILVISADATAPRLERMLDLGARGYLLKPFPPEMLIAEVERALAVTPTTAPPDSCATGNA